MNSPCYQCAERSARCHSECERYGKYAEAIRIQREERSKSYAAHDCRREWRDRYLHRNHREKRS